MATHPEHSLGPVFLSASIPSPDRDPAYLRTANLAAIHEAISALTLVVTPKARLVFGGHPSITPLVQQTAEQLGAAHHVVIYQSSFFEHVIPSRPPVSTQLRWTPVGAGRDASLLLMRQEMISSEPFHAGVFIGGMEGVEEEARLFQQLHPHALLLAVASTGAAARVLFDQRPWGSKDPALLSDTAYADLFRRLLLGSSGPSSPRP